MDGSGGGPSSAGRPQGFRPAAVDAFAFLVDRGFRLVRQTDDYVRYESPVRSVVVTQEPGDYEVGVWIGRWVDVGGERREDVVSLRDVLAGPRSAVDKGRGL